MSALLPTHHDGSDQAEEGPVDRQLQSAWPLWHPLHPRAKTLGLAGAGVPHGAVRNFVFPYGPNIWLKCCKYFSRSAVFELYLFISKRKKCTYME